MADVNYTNTMSLRPQFDWQPRNALAGMMYGQNNDDYRYFLEQQARMQAMEEEKRRMMLDEDRKNIPLKDLQRNLSMETGQGQLPHARELAGSAARAGIAENNIQASPERTAAALSDFRLKLDTNQRRVFDNTMNWAASVLPGMIEMKNKNPMALGEYTQQIFGQAKQAGIDIPPFLNNPDNWDAVLNAAVNNVQQQRDIGKIREEGKFKENVAQIEMAKTIQRGRESDASAERRAQMLAEAGIQRVQARPEPDLNLEKEIVKLTPAVRQGDPQAIQEVTAHLSTLWDRDNKGNAIYAARPEMARKAKEKAIREYFNALGQGTNPSNQQQRPDLKSFLR